MIARPREIPLIAKSLNAVLATQISYVAKPVSLVRDGKHVKLGTIPFGIPNVDSVGFVSSKSGRDLDPPMLNQGADVECCCHWAERALRLLLSKADCTG